MPFLLPEWLDPNYNGSTHATPALPLEQPTVRPTVLTSVPGFTTTTMATTTTTTLFIAISTSSLAPLQTTAVASMSLQGASATGIVSSSTALVASASSDAAVASATSAVGEATSTSTPIVVMPVASGPNVGVIVGSVIAFAVPIILGICLFLILRYRRRSRAIEEEGADFNPPLPGDKDASNYQQLHSPVSANGAAGFDSVAPLSYIGGGSKGGNGAPGARNQSRGLPEMQQKQMPGGANDSTDLAMDDMVQVTMLDDDEDEGVSSGPALQLPVMPKLQTTFSLGSNPSSVDEAEFESPETMVASTQSPSKDKDHAYTEAVARQLSVEPIMIAVADVRLGEEYLSSPIQHTIRKPYQFKQAAMEMEEKQPDSATTDVSASTGAYYTPTSEIAETPITATRAAPSTAGPVQQKSQRPPSPSRYRFDEERLPRMVNVMSIVSQPSEDSLSPVTAATSQPAPTSPAVAPVAPPATSLAPKPSIRSAKKAAPASGISDLLSLYAGMSEHGEEEEGEPYELETPTTAVSSATSLDKGKQVVRDYVPQDEEEDSIPEPDSPIPTNGVLARKGTTKTIHELENVATFRPRVARAFKAGIKSGAASVILSEEATTVPLDGTKAAVKQNGRFESFLGIIDGSGEQ